MAGKQKKKVFRSKKYTIYLAIVQSLLTKISVFECVWPICCIEMFDYNFVHSQKKPLKFLS